MHGKDKNQNFIVNIFWCSCVKFEGSSARHVNLDDSLFYQLDAQILYFTTFITFLYLFRTLLCSSSGGQLYYYSIWYRHSGNK